ncbi:hypothetical protein GCM10011369_09370 [Neiella marina]|uniref:Transmembrane protein (PGPGW) n=1 Tax=Neiella marina TaxID=508461 RepID=A0A8J2U3C2_9GAMM|nr:PGPGW domain-containing protein [Neiella marina]GGA69830.1 hypothetical protein GCM10011369_09370 [Neiella marina]
MQALDDMKRMILSVTGGVLLVVGLILIPMPVPIGLAMTISGLALLIHSNDTVRHYIRDCRQRYPNLNEKIRRAGAALPKPLRRIVSRTKPLIQRHKKGAD